MQTRCGQLAPQLTSALSHQWPLPVDPSDSLGPFLTVSAELLKRFLWGDCQNASVIYVVFFIFTFAVASWKTDLKFLPTCSFPQLSGGISACSAEQGGAPGALQPGAWPHLRGGLLSGPRPQPLGASVPSSAGLGAHPRSLTPAAPVNKSMHGRFNKTIANERE